MTISEDTPTFNLKAVVKETGIKPDTLRAWERRYGLPEPDRTGGGHRIYSQRDIDTLKWLLDRQEEGLSISRAVDLWNSLLQEGNDPLLTAPYVHTEAALPIEPGKALQDLRQAWVQACMAFDERSAETILNQAFAVYPPEAVTQHVIQLGLAEIGQGWYRGQITVQQEHFATELAMRRLEAQVAAAPPPSRPGRILVVCPPGEDHSFPALLITFLLRRTGWDVIYLGANVPMSQLDATIESTRPKLVILSAQSLVTAAALAEMARRLSEDKIMVAYGGGVFVRIPDLKKHIPGHYLSDDISAIHGQVEAVLSASPSPHAPQPTSQEMLDLYTRFQGKRASIGIAILEDSGLSNIRPDHLDIANRQLSHNIAAALLLGDLNYLQEDLTWVQGLISNLSLPTQILSLYVEHYAQAVKLALGDAGQPISQALERIEFESA
ncbi:MAG: MerR family transcriptional regulator [Anaerolineales bacterium]|jgi:DNA-binding transcriptional MerR regulator/methylmalonyl-CoA mutase cobalamin-binding subunit